MFFKKKHTPLNLSWLKTDMHAHLLPGIDDGAPDISTSIELIRGLQQLGYQKLIATPHIFAGLYPNTPDIIASKSEEVRQQLAREGIGIEFHSAAEYFIDEEFTDALKSKKPLLTLSGNLVLVEFSMLTSPIDLSEVLFEMQMQDYQPVLAHPERYSYLARNKDFYEELRTAGCLFQLNLLSLTNYYGDTVQHLADHLLKNNYYDFAGTDIHHYRQLAQLQKLPPAALKRLQDSDTIRNHQL